MIKGGKKNIKRKLWNNMGSENKKLIIPYRYMPFDIGTSIQELITEPKFFRTARPLYDLFNLKRLYRIT